MAVTLVRHIAASLAGQVALMALNIAGGIILARFLGPDGRGIYAAVTLWPQAIATFGIAGVGQALMFFAAQADSDRRRVYRHGATIAMLQTAIMATIAAAIVPFAMHGYGDGAVLLSLILIPMALVNTTHMLFKSYHAANGDYPRFNVATLLPQVLFVPLLCLFLFLDPTSTHAVIALGGSSMLAVILLAPGIIRRFPRRSAKTGARFASVFGFSLRAAPFDLSAGLAGFADRLVLVPIVPAAQLGLYAVAFSVSRLITLPSALLSTLMYSRMLNGDATQAKAVHDNVFRLAVAFLATGLVVLFAVDRWALTTVYGPDFAAAAGLVRILAVEAAATFLSQITAQYFVAAGRPGLASSIQAGYTLCYVAAIAGVAPFFGIEGAALALMLCSIARCVALLLMIPAVIGVPIGRLYPRYGDIATCLRQARNI